MLTRTFSLSGDLGRPYVIVAIALAVIGAALLLVEVARGGRDRRARLGIAASGLLAVTALLAAVLRPVAILSRGSLVGPRVVVLVDGSRSMDLAGDGGTRREVAARALADLGRKASDVRLSVLEFGDGAPTPPLSRSDLAAALESVSRSSDERPAAIVVVSDGRLERPGPEATEAGTRAALGGLAVPVHTVAVASKEPVDAQVRAVRAAGAAVAHQPFSLRVEIACTGGLACDEIPVAVRELREQGAATPLANGAAHVRDGVGAVELPITIERAGARIVEVEIKSPSGDTIPDDDRRLVTLDVTRDRVRVLHVAGRPTYDVRALRMWLKSDASVDVVAFFILRTPTDDVVASQDELALIPFPVDELFTEQLPTFDAVVLQDFNAEPYGLSKHLRSLARYVDKGGGLIMVGGPDAFVSGHYEGTPLADVLPVALPRVESEKDRENVGVDLASFVPRFTDAGRGAPVLAPLRALLGEDLPEMPGVDLVGDARPGATVLLTHPTRTTKTGAPMPVLALGDHGSGRTIALGIDGTHRLLFSRFAASAAGRAHGAFWDAMLGWLMRDPRFEPASVDVRGACIAGAPTTLLVRPLPGEKGPLSLRVRRLGTGDVVRTATAPASADGAPVAIEIGELEAGGYSATVEIGAGDAKGPTTRRDFACERGGDEWADPRPDAERLRSVASATGGAAVAAADVGALPLPAATQVAAERHVAPLLPPWAWTFAAAALLGAHWIARRRAGLA
jgi:uncharacterized membrane protein